MAKLIAGWLLTGAASFALAVGQHGGGDPPDFDGPYSAAHWVFAIVVFAVVIFFTRKR